MRTPNLIRQAVLFVSMGLSAQEGSKLFQLWLPDFFDTPFTGANTLVELPDRRIQRLRILVRDAQQRNINPGRYKIFVNGKGLGNVFEERTTPEGTLLVMEPETLRKRPDELFDPRENAIEMMAEDRRGRHYYQNWIVRVNDRRENALFGYSSTVSPDDPKAVPPDLVITEPAIPPFLAANQPSAKIVLKGRLSAGATLRVNGQPALAARQGAVFNFEYAVTVAANQRELVLEAADARGNSRKVVIPVYASTPNAPRIRFAGQKYAVLIGVSRFGATKESPPQLALAASNVEEFARSLEKHGGFKHENIRLLTDEKATLEMVRVAFSDFAAKAQSNDMLVVYIATHGLHDPRPNRGDKLYLALHGTQLAVMDSTALPFSDLEFLLNRSVRTNQCFLIFDVGHELTGDWRFQAGHNLVNNHVLKLFSDKSGWSVLVSGSTDDISVERKMDGEASSLFNYWLAQALRGEADFNGDHVVTAKELFSFVSEKVKTESQGVQQPRYKLATQGGDQSIGVQ